MRTINDINFEDKKAIIRVDFNVPLNESLEVTDTTRIHAAKPTIIHVLEQGGAVILMSHLGRPDGVDESLSLKHICSTASEILGVHIKYVADTTGEQAQQAAAALEPGEILLLENLRFHKEETNGDLAFAKALSNLADVYINDAFGTAHRAHASTTIIAQFFEDRAAGLLLQAELDNINKVLETPERPVVAILGGAKVSSKITVIENVLPKVDSLIIGGGMAYTFVKALGGSIGDSLVEEDKLTLAKEIISLAAQHDTTLVFPTDALIADAFENDAETKTAAIDQIPEGWMGLDIGPESIQKFTDVIVSAKTILWNGPVGVFEMSSFSKGTVATGEAVSAATAGGAFSLVGGGDSVAAVKQFGFEKAVSYISTGGGAMLELLEGKTLPGVAALD